MRPQGYLEELRRRLSGLPTGQRDELVEEIRSHLEAGEDDPRMGDTPDERSARLRPELGSADQMARGFKRVHQQADLLDYLLVAIPCLLNLPINLLLMSLMPRYPWADVRFVIAFHFILLGIALRRNSILVTLYWLTDLVVQLAFVLWYAKGFYGPPQTLFWQIVLIGLTLFLGRTIWRNRHEAMLVLYGLLPALMAIFALGLRIIPVHRSGWDPAGFLLNVQTWTTDFLYYPILVVLGFFFLVRNRDLRWGSLIVYWILLAIYHPWLEAYVVYPSSIQVVWLLLPLTLLAFGWAADRLERRPLREAAHQR